MPDFDRTVAALRKWAKDRDIPYIRAAVELLIWHEGWLRRSDFLAAAVVKRGPLTVISWDMARKFTESGPRASTSELAILDYAVALGEDRFRIANMGHAHRRSMANAMMIATGLAEVAPSGDTGKEAGDGA